MFDHHFHQVIALHETEEWSWQSLTKMAPSLVRGWYELSRLSTEERIEFTYGFWLSKLSFAADHDGALQRKLEQFFDHIEEVGIYLVVQDNRVLAEPHMVYSLKNDAGYFQGAPPADKAALDMVIKSFASVQLPADYLGFLQIHDGFSKYTDTGLIKTRELAKNYQRLQQLFASELLIGPTRERVDPAQLIPFYESFGLHNYQCFHAGWHPKEEIGNVYFSELERAMSNFLDESHLEDNLAFSTFLEWLMFYLDEVPI